VQHKNVEFKFISIPLSAGLIKIINFFRREGESDAGVFGGEGGTPFLGLKTLIKLI